MIRWLRRKIQALRCGGSEAADAIRAAEAHRGRAYAQTPHVNRVVSRAQTLATRAADMLEAEGHLGVRRQ